MAAPQAPQRMRPCKRTADPSSGAAHQTQSRVTARSGPCRRRRRPAPLRARPRAARSPRARSPLPADRPRSGCAAAAGRRAAAARGSAPPAGAGAASSPRSRSSVRRSASKRVHVARRAEQPAHGHVAEPGRAQRPQLGRVELHVVVGVDDLVRPARASAGSGSRTPRRRPAGARGRPRRAPARDPARARSTGPTARTSKLRPGERQGAHVRHHRLAVLAGQRRRRRRRRRRSPAGRADGSCGRSPQPRSSTRPGPSSGSASA